MIDALPLMRLCELCGGFDALPHHDLVLASAPETIVEIRMHVACAETVLTCPTCGPHIAMTTGVSGAPLRDRIIAHHTTQTGS